MIDQAATPPHGAFAMLQGFAKRRARLEPCELCAAPLGLDHQHLLDPAERKLLCACEACAVLFSSQSGARMKRVPRRVVSLEDFRLTDAEWETLRIPINMAFFFYSTPDHRLLALYPSPAGATESQLALEGWKQIVDENPALRAIEPDVEALLVDRLGRAEEGSHPAYYIAPIDECYRLVGLIRTHWRGLSGGAEVWREVSAFFAGLQERASVVRGGECA